jgi:hypothetical protein
MRRRVTFFLAVVNNVFGMPVYGGMGDFGYYFTDIAIGTPPQRMSVIIDTGSDGLSVACTTCEACGRAHLDPFYNPEISISFEYLEECPAIHLRNPTCTFEKRYLEGSVLKGRMFLDHVSVMGTGIDKKIPFGCIESETKLFLDQRANGIMGLSVSSSTHLLYTNEPKVTAFTLCLAKAGGEMDMHSEIEKPEDAIKLEYRNKHYVVDPTEISIKSRNGDMIWSSTNVSTPISDFVGPKTLIDSGSTVTYLKESLFTKLIDVINTRLRGEGLLPDKAAGTTACWFHPSDLDIKAQLPTIEIKLQRLDGKGSIATSLKDFMTHENSGADQTKSCLTVASNRNLDRTDLGASWLLNKQVTFTSNAGWMQVVETTCTEHAISYREMVIPLEGQLTRRTYASTRLGVIAVISLFSLILIVIVKRSTSAQSAVIATSTE